MPIPRHPSTSRWTVLAAVLIGTFVGTLGNSVSNVALPAIMQEFDVPLGSAVWVVTLYVLTFAVLMPAGGYLGDLLGQRRLYLWGMALFTVALLGSALARTFPWLLGSRVLLGIGIAPTLPAVMAIITASFAPGERGRAMGMWALVNGAAHALGPPLSGFLTETAGWRVVFLFTLPLCIANLVLVALYVPPDGKRRTAGFDLPGAAALTATALGLMLAITQSTRSGWLSPGSLALWGVTVASAAAFVVVEKRTSAPFVDLSLLSDRRYAAAVAVIAAQYFCLFGLLLALPVFLIDGQDWSDSSAGLLVLPLPLAMAAAAPLAGRLADAHGSRAVCTGGMMLVVAAGLLLLAQRPSAGQPLAWWAIGGSLLLMGTGMGLIQTPVTAAVTRVVPVAQVGVTTGIFHMGRFVSGSLGSTVFGLMMEVQAVSLGAGLERNLLLVIAVSTVAVVASLQLPGAATPSPAPPRQS